MPKLNVNQLKYLAAFFMVLDSAYLAMPLILPTWFHLFTRFVAPLFAFFLTEGFFYTRNRVKYGQRLWLAGVLMQIGDYASYLLLAAKYQIHDNIFLTLAMGFSVMYLWERSKEQAPSSKLALRCAALAVLFLGFTLAIIPLGWGDYYFMLEGGIALLSVIFIFYLFHGHWRKQITVFLLWNVIFLKLVGISLPWHFPSWSLWFEDFCFNSEGLTFMFLPFLFFYSGEKGSKSTFSKYFFYVFYPAHLWILHLLALAMD